MKKLKKINLELNKEVISSLSGNEMNNVKGGTNLSFDPNLNCTGTNPLSVNGNSCPEPATRIDFTCVADVCQPQTQVMCIPTTSLSCPLVPSQNNCTLNCEVKPMITYTC